MLPLSDRLPARNFPFVNLALIIANFAVWIFYELPNLDSAVAHSSFYPCTVDNACSGPLPWGIAWITAMFMHGSWDHILGNMLFLVIFGKTIAAVLGAYLVLYPTSRVLTLVGIWLVRIPAYIVLGLWFLYQLIEANFGLLASNSDGEGVAFFAHVGGFVFGFIVARWLTRTGRVEPQDYDTIVGARA